VTEESAGERARWPPYARLRSPRRRSPDVGRTTTFKDLIEARKAHLEQPSGERWQAYREQRAEFVASYGELEDVYWGKDGRSGAAITVGGRGKGVARLHTVTDEATGDAPEIAAAIQDWQILGVRAQLLRGQAALVCMRWVLAGITYLLASVVAHDGSLRPAHSRAVMMRQRTALANANAYYVVNASRRGHVTYFWGMILGAAVNALLAIGILLVLHWFPKWLWEINIDERQEALGLAAVVAGALGSIFSVLLRMSSGRFAVDYEVDAGKLIVLGSFRPFLGAVSGLALYLALQADFLSVKGQNSFFVIAFLAFLAGFSERFARDVFGSAERTALPVAATGAQPPPSSGVSMGPGSDGGVADVGSEQELPGTSSEGDRDGSSSQGERQSEAS